MKFEWVYNTALCICVKKNPFRRSKKKLFYVIQIKQRSSQIINYISLRKKTGLYFILHVYLNSYSFV